MFISLIGIGALARASGAHHQTYERCCTVCSCKSPHGTTVYFLGVFSFCGPCSLKLCLLLVWLGQNWCTGGAVPLVIWRWQHWATYLTFLPAARCEPVLPQRCLDFDCHSDFLLLNDCMYANDSALFCGRGPICQSWFGFQLMIICNYNSNKIFINNYI